MSHPKPDDDITDLAVKHITRHPNDKSKRYLAKMRRSFGSLAATQALKKAISTYSLVYPELHKLLEAHNAGGKWNGHENINLERVLSSPPFYQETSQRSFRDRDKLRITPTGEVRGKTMWPLFY